LFTCYLNGSKAVWQADSVVFLVGKIYAFKNNGEFIWIPFSDLIEDLNFFGGGYSNSAVATVFSGTMNITAITPKAIGSFQMMGSDGTSIIGGEFSVPNP
jgi:hypothetical protein